LPKTLDETYERTLQDIDEENWEYAHRLFQCITVASRPLRVEELAEFLAFDFDAGLIPTFFPEWRPEDPRDAVLSTCSSLITIVKANRSWVIQFSHFSVKEFLMSSRLATARTALSRRYHVLMAPAHSMVARACLGILLHPNDQVTGGSIKKFYLAEYAARHWVDHAQFEHVSSNIQDGMKCLFDPRKPYFAVWVSIYDPDVRSVQSQGSTRLSQSRGTPLRYAAYYGLCDVVEFLLVERSQDVNARRAPRNETALSVASTRGHLEVTQLLLEHHAEPNAREYGYRTPLHGASQRGLLDIVRVLLEYGADPNAMGVGNTTPLHLALHAGHLKVALVLLEHGADANAQGMGNSTPLHLALQAGQWGFASVLLEHGADANIKDHGNRTPLHQASQGGNLESARFLLGHGADANLCDGTRSTPLHLALQRGHVEVARVLLEYGADANAWDVGRWTALHRASKAGHLEVVRLLLEHGADANPSRGNGNWSPLHFASKSGHLEVVRLLLEHGADANSRTAEGCAALHHVAKRGHAQVARVLLQYGASASAQGSRKRTPLHRASEGGHLELARILLEHGADANAPDDDNQTPLHKTENVDMQMLLMSFSRRTMPTQVSRTSSTGSWLNRITRGARRTPGT
jgi:ankyrin repeat protein